MKTILMLAVMLTIACTPYKMLTTNQSTDHRSVERTIDTITKVVTDSSVIRALLECDSIGRVKITALKQQNSDLQTQFFELVDNQLTVKNSSKSEVRIREIIKIDTIVQTIEMPVIHEIEKEVIRLRWWQTTLIWVGVASILLTILKQTKLWQLLKKR